MRILPIPLGTRTNSPVDEISGLKVLPQSGGEVAFCNFDLQVSSCLWGNLAHVHVCICTV